MVTFLDLLVVVVMVLCAVSLVAMALMFLVKNKKVKQICLYLVAALGVYMGYVGFRIMWVNSLAQTGLAVALALAAIGAVVLERLSKGSEKKFLLSQVLASASLVIGMFNAFMIKRHSPGIGAIQFPDFHLHPVPSCAIIVPNELEVLP